MGLRMKIFNIMGGSLKNPIFRGEGGGGGWEGAEKPIYIGDLPKRWGLGQFPNLRGGGGGLAKKRGGGVFDGGRGDTLMHTMN